MLEIAIMVEGPERPDLAALAGAGPPSPFARATTTNSWCRMSSTAARVSRVKMAIVDIDSTRAGITMPLGVGVPNTGSRCHCAQRKKIIGVVGGVALSQLPDVVLLRRSHPAPIQATQRIK